MSKRTPGNLVNKSKLSTCSGSAAMRQLNPLLTYAALYLNIALHPRAFYVDLNPLVPGGNKKVTHT